MDPIWDSVHQERAALIRDLGQLDPDDWAIETQCQGWRVREVVAHLIDTATTTPLSFLTAMVCRRPRETARRRPRSCPLADMRTAH